MALQDTQPDNRSFLSPIGFQFSIQKLPHVNYFCTSANVPDITLGVTGGVTNPFINLPQPAEKLTFGTLDVVFQVDEDMKNYKEMYNWLIGLGYPDNFEQRSNISRRKGATADVGTVFADATLLITTAANKVNIGISFIDAFPTSLSTLQFNIQETDVEYLQATASFTYRKYEILDIV